MRFINEKDPYLETPEIEELRSRIVLIRYDSIIRLSYCERDGDTQNIRWYESTTGQLLGATPDGWAELPILKD